MTLYVAQVGFVIAVTPSQLGRLTETANTSSTPIMQKNIKKTILAKDNIYISPIPDMHIIIFGRIYGKLYLVHKKIPQFLGD
jgi:hypothetical protein